MYSKALTDIEYVRTVDSWNIRPHDKVNYKFIPNLGKVRIWSMAPLSTMHKGNVNTNAAFTVQ